MTKPWADQPFKLIPSPTEKETQGISKQTVGVATDMALAHGLIIRNLNAIYLQAEGVSKAEDIKDFILFAQVVMDEIHLHHAFEEQYFFPWIGEYTGEKDIMETNIAQHHAFEKGIKKFREYIDNVTPEIYDGKEMKRFLNEFGPILSQHLTDEIATLLGLDKYGGDKLKATSDRLEAKVIASLTEKHKVLPAALGARDATWEGGKWNHWPPFPWFVPYLTKYYYSRRHRGSWRFSPCTVLGIPRPLEFVTEE